MGRTASSEEIEGNDGITIPLTLGNPENMESEDQMSGQQIDGAVDFDGSDEYIQTTSNELKTENNFTVSVWLNADDLIA